MRLDFTSDLTTTTLTLAATLYNDIRSARHNNRKLFPVLTGNAPCRTSSATPRQAQIHSIARSQAGSGSTAATANLLIRPWLTHMCTHTHSHTYTHSGYASAAASGCVTASKRCVIFFYIYFMILFLFFFLLLLASTFIQLCPLTLP